MTSSWTVENLSYSVSGKTIVNSASVELHSGEIVGLLGPNGAGKSTLLRLATGLLPSASGRILLNTKEIDQYSRTEIARLIAFVPQDTHVEFEFSAYDVALMGRNPFLGRFQWPTKADHEAVRQAMEQTNTFHLARQPITTLSGGERQGIFLARALAAHTPFLALDEPTSNLDLEHSLHFLQLLRNLARNEQRGILIAMHDLNWASRFCDRVVLMHHGLIIQQGPPNETLTPEHIRQVFHVEALCVPTPAGPPLLDFHVT